MTSDSAPALSQAIVPTWTALHTFNAGLASTTVTESSTNTLTSAQASNTSADGMILQDITAASTGNQQYSPRLRFTGQGWKTTATAASQESDFIIENQPQQGATSPSGKLVISAQTNNGGYAVEASLTSAGQWSSATYVPTGATAPSNGYYLPTANTVGISTSSTERQAWDGNGHTFFTGTVPAVSACGTSPAIDPHATDSSGTVTVGSGTDTSCTVTFATAYVTWVHCTITPEAPDAGFAYSYTKIAITVSATSLTSIVFDYRCDGS